MTGYPPKRQENPLAWFVALPEMCQPTNFTCTVFALLRHVDYFRVARHPPPMNHTAACEQGLIGSARSDGPL